MKEGILLYQQFRSLLKQTGDLKLAWFTTFNLEVSFFEKYILSGLTGMEPDQIRTINDYEAMNEILFGSSEDSFGTDVRVFHDYRALGLKEVKRTSVKILAIDPDKLGAYFRGGVFHPKVSLLINQQDEGYIMTGSANLTLSGWGRNIESVVLKKISDSRNARQIIDFFAKLCDRSGRNILNRILKIWEGKLQEKSDWEFHHSFQKESFLDKIQLSGNPIYIWSPYFSDNIQQLIDHYFQEAEKIHIIPDFLAGGLTRMNLSFLQTIKENPGIDILRIGVPSFNEETLIHAKIWLTKEKLAIGSWNFTSAAIGHGKSGNNIEAGIIQSITQEDQQKIVLSFNLVNYKDQCQGKEKSELDEDRKTILNPWSFSCSVEADWEKFEYKLVIERDITLGDYNIELPGIKSRVNLKQFKDHPLSFYEGNPSVLRDRLFTIYDNSGEKVYIGIITEINVKERPAMGFEHIRDFISGWIEGKPENNKGLHRVNYTVEGETTGEEINDLISQSLDNEYEQTWFRMFLAMERMKKRLFQNEKKEKEIKLIGYQIPGSVTQLKNHLEQLKELFIADNRSYSAAYVWFIINEGNLVIKTFNDIKRKYLKNQDQYPDVSLVQNISLIFNKKDRAHGEKWLRHIEKECKYIHA